MKAMGTLQLRVLGARVVQAIGWAGIGGLGLMAVGVTWWGLAYRTHTLPLPVVDGLPAVTPRSEAPAPLADSEVKLPGRAELPLLLTQIQQTVVGHGLGWTAADYKVVAATEGAPATLEVRCRLGGTYPKVRAALAQLLQEIPGLSIRDLAMSRVSVDVAEVEAKLTLVVFLQDERVIQQADRAGGQP